MVSHVHNQGEWMLSYRVMQMQMASPQQGTHSFSSLDVFNNYLVNTPSMEMNMQMVMGMYGITDRLTAMVMLNYISNSMQMEFLNTGMAAMHGMSNASTMEMKSSGLGDTKLQLLYGLIKNEGNQLILGIGASLPTGSIQQKGQVSDVFYASSRFPMMMQLGSGTLDILPTISYVRETGSTTYGIQSSAIIHSTTNKNAYCFGDEVVLNSWFAYNWWRTLGTSIRVEAQYIGKMIGYDKAVYMYNEIGANPANYGGTFLQSFIGTSYEFTSGFIQNNRFAIEYGLPIYQQLNGIQNKRNQSWMASWSYSF
jgi:hypothetical protein